MIARRSIQELKFNYPTNVHLQNISLIERQESRDAVKSRQKTCYLVHSRKKRKKGKPTLSTYHSITRTISQAWKIDSIENDFTIVRSGDKYEFRLSLSLSLSIVSRDTMWRVPKDIMTDKQGRGWRTAFLFPPGMAHGGLNKQKPKRRVNRRRSGAFREGTRVYTGLKSRGRV